MVYDFYTQTFRHQMIMHHRLCTKTTMHHNYYTQGLLNARAKKQIQKKFFQKCFFQKSIFSKKNVFHITVFFQKKFFFERFFQMQIFFI